MRSRVCCLALSLLLSLLFVAFGAVPLKASAALSGGRYMTPSEAQQVFGSEISFSYYDGNDYTDSSFLYNGTASAPVTAGSLPANWSDFSGATFLEYVATVQSPAVVVNPNYITVDIHPTYSIFDTDQITSLIALSNISSSVSTIYQSPSWDWVIGGNTIHYENSLDDGNGLYSSLSFRQHFYCTFVPMQYSGQSLTSGYSYRATFCGNAVGGSSVAGAIRYKYYLYIMCPYISADAEGASGTFSGTSSSSGGGDINVDVSVDMDETNGLLGDILDWLGDLLDGIAGLFIPSAAYLEDFSSDLEEAAVDHLGGVWEAEQLIEDHIAVFTDTAASGSITIPSASIPLAGETFVFPPAGSNTVDLKPDALENSSFSLLYDGLALIIDFICVAAFLNMCKKKVELFLLPDTEVITD